MKYLPRLIVVLVLLAGATVAWAEPAASAPAQAGGVKTYAVSDLQKLDRFPLRELIGIKFNYRHKRIRHLKPNWYQGSLWGYAPEGKKKFVFVQVMVPRDALAAFKAITTDHAAGEEHLVYGQVLQDREATKWRFIRLFGTKLERDAAGKLNVSW